MYSCSAHEACNVERTQWYRIDGFTLLPFSSLQMQVTPPVYVDSFMGDETNKPTRNLNEYFLESRMKPLYAEHQASSSNIIFGRLKLISN